MMTRYYLVDKLGRSKLLQRIVIYLFTLISIQFSYAQNESYSDSQSNEKVSLGEVNYQVVFPLSGFSRNVDRSIHGINLSLFKQIKFAKPQFLGIVIAYSRIAHQQGNFVDLDGFITNRSVTSNWFKPQLAYRIYPEGYFGKFDPFVSALLGANIIYTTINDIDPETEEGINYQFDDLNLSIAYGMELGSHFNLTESLLFSFKIAYHSGSISKYLIADNPNASNPLNRTEIKSSSLESLNLLFGLTFAF